MATKKKMLQAAAGQAGGAGLDITDVFSTYLYAGNNSTQTITNGIDLAGEGGLVWIKERAGAGNEGHRLLDTERGPTKVLMSNNTGSNYTIDGGFDNFTSTGFTLKTDNGWSINSSAPATYASWTFRKAPKFFDVVTYTGTGSARTLSHNLGSVPGMIITKRLDSTSDWGVYHRSYGAGGPAGILNGTDAAFNLSTYWNNTNPTSDVFSLGSFANVNANGGTYVAYLFAHNDGDGEFGPNADQDIIKCGSYTGNASNSAGPIIDLGFEPQWVMIKSVDGAFDWFIADTMRGWTATHPDDDNLLRANTSGAETANTEIGLVNSTGFQIMGGGAEINGNGQNYIYMAIRRGPLAPPESGTEVFAIDTATQDSTAETHALSYYDSGWFLKRTGGDAAMSTQRILPNRISFETGQYASLYWDAGFDNNQGKYFAYSSDPTVNYFLKRAPGFFDHLAYAGTGSVNTHQHNLTVQPEMMWVRKLNTGSADAFVYHKDLSASTELTLNGNAPSTNANIWNNTRPTDAVFTVGTSSSINDNEGFVNFYAMLFASVSGVSKVGSYTGNGSSQTIDCGFTSGARFVLIKRADSSGNWFVWDSQRGIVSGSEPFLILNQNNAEQTGSDEIDPNSSGFTVNQSFYTDNNVSGASYIFYAIA